MTAKSPGLQQPAPFVAEPLGLSAADHAWLWQLARRLHECESVVEAEAMALLAIGSAGVMAWRSRRKQAS